MYVSIVCSSPNQSGPQSLSSSWRRVNHANPGERPLLRRQGVPQASPGLRVAHAYGALSTPEEAYGGVCTETPYPACTGSLRAEEYPLFR